ncbi:MAG: M28 family peptidase, partial [Candidatus Zixiibacteriota bacterium]
CETRTDPPPFDGRRAYQYLIQQVAFGPRVPGSEASAECRKFMLTHFVKLGGDIDSQVFTFSDPYSQTEIKMVNLIARFNAAITKSDRVILMAHYDCRPRTDYAHNRELKDMPIDGANDGASGVAVLMELANLFTQQTPPVAVDLVLVDGEDWGKVGDNEYYLLGSKEFVRHNIRGKYRFGVVIDMVGDSSQEIYREGYSEQFYRSLNDMIWRAAGRLGIASFRDSVKHSIIDDHLSLNSVGVPAVCLIDFDYPYWHTEFDTPDKCSAASLANVGQVLVEIIYNPSLWPKN